MAVNALTTVLLAVLLAGTSAKCPNNCSGHGACNKYDVCSCQMEGKTTYFGYLYDTAKGFNRVSPAVQTASGVVPSASCIANSIFSASYSCDKAFDGNLGSAWATAGMTVGSFIQSNFDGSYRVSGFSFKHRTTDEKSNGITLTFSDGSTQDFNLPDDDAINTFAFATTVVATSIRITVTSAHDGATDNNGATEIQFFGVKLPLVEIPRSIALAKGAFAQAKYTGADCSLMTCPRGISWTGAHKKVGGAPSGKHAASTDVAGNGEGATKHQDFAECSDMGNCDRATGACACFPGFEGPACQRTICPNACSGHGTCQSNVKFSEDASTVHDNHAYLGAWDSGIQMGCKCDLGYRGADCAAIECPSSSDPLGWHGNDQGEDCSGRGLCDYSSGVCNCFSGFTGQDCATINALA